MPSAIPANCLSCGTEIRVGDRFCSQCGTVVRPVPTLPTAAPPPPLPPPTPPVAASPTPRWHIRSKSRGNDSAPWSEAYGNHSGTAPPLYTPAPKAEGSRFWASLAPLSVLLGAPFTIGLASFVVPLLVWQGRKDVDPFASNHGRQALNFVLSMTLYAVLFLVLTIVTIGVGALVAIPGWIGIALAWLWFSIVGTVKSLNGDEYDYPMTINFLKA